MGAWQALLVSGALISLPSLGECSLTFSDRICPFLHICRFLITTIQVGSLLNLLSSFLRRACPGVRSHDVHMYGFLGPFVIP